MVHSDCFGKSFSFRLMSTESGHEAEPESQSMTTASWSRDVVVKRALCFAGQPGEHSVTITVHPQV